jgi:NAD(P)-dependent dehydrogenase (short-subunit alcohol dehydrogenase family)
VTAPEPSGEPARGPAGDASLGDASRFATYPSLRNEVVLVSGGATGIGASFVAHFAAQGARVAFLDVDGAAGARLSSSMAQLGLPAPLFELCDVRDIGQLRGAVARVSGELGPVAVLVNNAANDVRADSATLTVEQWDDSIAVNLRHHFFAIQSVAPMMRSAGRGSIVNLGSISAHADFTQLAGYISSKGGIESLTRTMARELGPDGVRVNCVIPGWVMTERQKASWVTPEIEAAVERAQCLSTKLVPADVARLVLWLAADDSRSCTGQSWVVDGGWT